MTAPHHLVSPDQYLDFEVHAETRHEYVDGVVYAMSGGSASHSLVAVNLIAALHGFLRGRPCNAFNGDMRVRVGRREAYVYPEASGLCGRAEIEHAQRAETLLNPSFVVEVLSPSTESYDRGKKFALYRRIPSLREYVLIAQDRMHVERYAPGADRDAAWERLDADGPGATVELPSVGAVLRLDDLYERVQFPPRPLRVREPAPASYAAEVGP